MAMSLPHQIGALSGTSLTAETGGVSCEVPAKGSSATSAMWRTPMTNLKVSVQKTGAEIDRVSPSPSPPMSPMMGGGMRPDLLACQALMEAQVDEVVEREYKVRNSSEKEKGVPVFVMMPLDSVKMDHTVNRKKAMNASLQALKSAGVEGIMMDVWWGLVERDAPGEYNWGGYAELMEMAKKHGLKVQAVMSFHQCGGNVGDSCTYVYFPLLFLLRLTANL